MANHTATKHDQKEGDKQTERNADQFVISERGEDSVALRGTFGIGCAREGRAPGRGA
jgi:hypothetical protein